MQKKYELFIHGEWVAPIGKKYFPRISPVHGREISRIGQGEAADIAAAVADAHQAFASWSRLPVAQRARHLVKIAARMHENLDFLARVQAEETGKPWRNPSRR